MVQQFNCTVVLKGSGTIVASPNELPRVNTTGNGLLATAGTGDVLAGLIGARLATGNSALEAACESVYLHGQVASGWPQSRLTASALARSLGR
jgi:NAD(P)H-hydrate repair Nnr-like enzyme with NAD(P)H-hydrate dehydratase domain